VTAPPAGGPVADESGVTLRFADPEHRLVAVSLVQEVAVPRTGPEFSRAGADGCWQVRMPRPAVDRMEYLLELLHPDGGTELVCDPHNPRTAPGAFGEKSVVEFPGYRPPAWLPPDPGDRPAGHIAFLEVDSRVLGASLPVQLWSSHGSRADEALPLLVVHDGVEYARYADLVVMLDGLVGAGTLPPMRAALMHPTARDEHYSASPAYAQALSREVLPHLHGVAPTAPGRHMRVGMGASLGALAMLHAHRMQPATFGGLFLQSGSFFHHRYDRHEIGFEHFQRIRWFMDRVHATRQWDQPIPVVMTCGRVEMNFANNRAAHLVLRAQGYDVSLTEVRDAHNWVGWRDALDPGLVRLLRELWT
jgi:enterochelin esterase-like enzyme